MLNTAVQGARKVTDELRERVRRQYWFHRIDLGDGLITSGHPVDDKIKAAHIPEDLRGKTVLDVGCWDGALSFECERRGAARVLATDYFIWNRIGSGGFDLAHQILGSRVEPRLLPVEEFRPERIGTFDIVLFLGVLYHAKNPMLYLERVRSVCRDLLILETHVDALDYPRPAAVFYPGATLNGDDTNFWGPNPAAVKAMLHEVGFGAVEEFPQYQPSRQVFHARVS